MKSKEKSKQKAAQAAVNYIRDGMTIGLGTGSTMNYFLEELKHQIHSGLEIQGIPTSKQTEKVAKENGIPLTDFSETTKIDIAIDGADEVDTNLQLIKGGGGSLVREKIVAQAADKLIIIVDASKRVAQLGDFPLPVEVIPFGWQKTAAYLETFGCTPVLRTADKHPFISDNGNYILDCAFETINEPERLHQQLKKLVGVVETGLFVNMTDMIISARNEVVEKMISTH
ncbi:ribose-5-phosphate isomerase RpiA [Virgibacillus pantothenticus]|uniref:ribose-5-phosphate isomerase RpiA n=1 Tax=Virgibacillus pantothenticus TaxID=1473 RepID=UPI00098699E4|nr:ribose-5-phosphate isomerase RpiA [Virgibacillus pantothenticus]